MLTIEDLIIPTNTVSDVPEEEYQQVTTLIATFDSISRIIYQGMYIIDYNRQNFLYVSDTPLFFCGHTAKEVKEMGYRFYVDHVIEEEHPMLKEINTVGFNFFEKVPVEERDKCTISFDFHLISGKKKTLVNQQLTPILLTKEGHIWLAACVLSFSSHPAPGNVILRITGRPFFWEYSLESHQRKEKTAIALNEREKDILLLSTQGYSMNEIADKMCISLDTVRFYKRNLFERLQVKNIVEAVSFAANYKLL